eukprot:TRINITY_DN5255_c0_g1_i1.p1 TRINITY_DN5255_c0_g1~~TRINITY_DN5255_c0_g1_i1.p1  ORF type:complete len:107 (+),score=2.38 TRINITY_DN5255_c0_g1_i1:630-950(+)
MGALFLCPTGGSLHRRAIVLFLATALEKGRRGGTRSVDFDPTRGSESSAVHSSNRSSLGKSRELTSICVWNCSSLPQGHWQSRLTNSKHMKCPAGLILNVSGATSA